MKNDLIRTRLVQILRDRNMTQVELARLSGVRESTISEIVNGDRFRSDTLEKICAALGIQPGDLLYLDNTQPA